MRLLEHQSKRLLAEFGLSFTQPELARTPEAAAAAAERAGGPVVVKAQVPFGGRGKAGAIVFADSPAATAQAAATLIGRDLNGHRIACVSVEPKVAVAQELYVGIAWDGGAKLPVAIVSTAGGVDVERSHGTETVAQRTFDPVAGLRAFEGRELARRVGISGKTMVAVGVALERLATAFLAIDGVTVEINPLVVTADGTLIGLDAHVEVDDDAAGRQRALLDRVGPIESGAAPAGGRVPTPLEVRAAEIDAMDHRGVAGRVVEFDGDLGLIIGGGGASLTAFDAIRRYGGRPANYCEVGGNPTEEKVALLVELLLGKPGVRRVAVIMNVVNNTRADVMARGVIDGVRRAGRDPRDAISVFRIPGSWEAEAREALAAVGVKALGRDVSIDEAARLAVERSESRVA